MSSTGFALYIDLSENPVEDTEEIHPGVMVDLDANGAIIGVEILDFMARLKEQTSPPAELQTA